MALTLDGTTGISASGNIYGNNVIVGGTISVGAITPTTVSASGNVIGGNILTAGFISAAGNITGQNINSANADLAEMYSADSSYPPGTVIEFGGDKEITICTSSHSTRVAGVVSTAPSYVMNTDQSGDIVLAVAMIGRVPCRVIGTIRKGDQIVSSDIPGVGTRLDPAKYQVGCVIGKSLENYDSNTDGVIEVVVGKY